MMNSKDTMKGFMSWGMGDIRGKIKYLQGPIGHYMCGKLSDLGVIWDD